MKWLLWALLLALGGLWITRSLRSGAKVPPAATPPEKPRPGTATLTMRACTHCGVHLAESDAVLDAQGRAFCSDAHRRAGPREAGP